jgi:hypothetical protein
MLNRYRVLTVAASALAALLVFGGPVHAALTPYDTPTVSCVSSGENSITLGVTAGLSGAPAGISIQWMKYDDYIDNGGWFDSDDPRLCKLSLSGQPSLRDNNYTRWELGSNAYEEVVISDGNYDETGVTAHNCGLDVLVCGTQFVFRVFAHAGRGFGRSDWSADVVCSTAPCQPNDCTYTQGYWKNHEEDWSVTSLVLGSCIPSRTYTQAELLTIFNRPAAGNGLISLAHQLIAAKLNLAQGNCSCATATTAIAAADALIGCLDVMTGSLAPSATSALNGTLTDFNEGNGSGCPGHAYRFFIGTNPGTIQGRTWGSMKAIYR